MGQLFDWSPETSLLGGITLATVLGGCGLYAISKFNPMVCDDEIATNPKYYTLRAEYILRYNGKLIRETE